MKKGFVFGKYLPFHLGHKTLMEYALGCCNHLYVVVCASDKESLDVKTRAKWIRETFAERSDLEVIEFEYKESDLPNTSTSSKVISKIWAEKFKELLPSVDLLITSEEYGDYVANFMNIKHIPFDKKRLKVPISATKIRDALLQNWHYLPAAVKRYYQVKIVFLGTESTGKSSISKALSKRFDSTLVEEVGRDIVPDSNHFTQDQLQQIATKHAENIQDACDQLRPFVFIDTDIHITQSYSKFQFGDYLDLPQNIYDINRADHYFYLTKDLMYSQDGTRLEEENRNVLDGFHRATLKKFGVEYLEISGDWEERLEKLVKVVSR